MDNREKRFSQEVKRLLAGEDIGAAEDEDEEYRSNIDFAGKIIECRSEPSPSFREGLKGRLLSRLDGREEVEARQQAGRASFRSWLGRLVPQAMEWRTAVATVIMAALALVVALGIGLLLPGREPLLTGPMGSQSILEPLFFGLGLASNVFLIFFFLVRKYNIDLLRRTGWAYLLLSLPAVYGIFLFLREQKDPQYGIFLGIFLAYLVLQGLYDFVLKVGFRRNWKLLASYLLLYYAMNYGFVVMSWKISTVWGIIMLCLFILQITSNLSTHQFGRKNEAR